MQLDIGTVRYKGAELVEPGAVRYVDSDSYEYLTLCKDPIRFIYQRLGVSYSVSNKIHNIDHNIWSEVFTPRLANRERINSLSDYLYVVSGSGEVICITETNISKNVEDFKKAVEELNADVSYSRSGVVNIKFSTSIREDLESVVYVEMDLVNGRYRVYDGVINGDRIIVVSNPVIDSIKFDEFIVALDIRSEVSMSSKLAENILSAYNKDTAEDMVMSVREVLDIVKMLGCKVDTDEDGFASEIFEVLVSSKETLVKFFRSFDMPYKSLKKLGYLRKSLKYGGMTIDTMLKLLSKEYVNPNNNSSASTIASLLKIYYNRESDREVLESET